MSEKSQQLYQKVSKMKFFNSFSLAEKELEVKSKKENKTLIYGSNKIPD